MADESVKGVLAEVEALAKKVAAKRDNTGGDVLTALHACAFMAKRATAENARDFALALMSELTSAIAEADRMGADVVAKVGR